MERKVVSEKKKKKKEIRINQNVIKSRDSNLKTHNSGRK